MAVEKLKLIEGMDVESGIRNCMDDEDLYMSIVDMFVAQLQSDLTSLQSQFEQQDWVAYGKTCHGIKGAAASVGASAVQNDSAILEAAGKNSDEAEIVKSHQSYKELLETTVAKMSEAIA